MGDYWIKLFHEILDDPKMALLPDRLWRRVIELYLLAGKIGKNGALPDARSIAWMLRQPTDEVTADLEQIAATRIIEHITNGYIVVNFSKRQGTLTNAEKQHNYRERLHRNQYVNEGVTSALPEVTQIKDIDTDNRLDNRTEERGRGSADAHTPIKGIEIDDLTVLQAQTIPEIKIFLQATGRMPGRPTYRKVIEVIGAHGFTAKQLIPFWEAWNERGFKPNNLAWLTEWAVNGEIPAIRVSAAPSSAKPEKQTVGSAIEEARRRLANANPG